MQQKKGYIGIDVFRVVAAFLVVAVHTAPLAGLGDTPDFISTRIVARLGVTFFFAATGFFLLAPFAENKRASATPVWRFLKKTALLYAVAMLLYLPVNIYAGHFDGVKTVFGGLKMVLADGTMYHLWYLPAVMLGAVLVWAMLRYGGLMAATMTAGLLYVVGLLGDSYYGFAANVPFLKTFFDGVFAVSEYSRNGLFFAPLFLLVGVWAARLQRGMTQGKVLTGFLVCFALMLAEGLLLHRAGVQRHDSMYIALPLCMLFLFSRLLGFRGKTGKALRDASMAIYIVHPLMIVLVRGAARPLGLTGLVVDNSVVHYLMVCIASVVVAGVYAYVANRFATGKVLQKGSRRTWVQVDEAALAHNVETLQGLLPEGCALMPALKADAYGLGAEKIGALLYKTGVRSFCVATLREGIELRQKGLKGEILVLGYTPPENAGLLRRYRLMQTVVDLAYAGQLQKQGKRMAVHVKIDTGMNRLGERADHLKEIEEILGAKNLDVKGVYTQLSACDSKEEEDVAFTLEQIDAFWKIVDALRSRGIEAPAPHIQCSYGILNYPQTKCAYARPGLAIYGIVDERCCLGTAPLLKVIFEVKAKIALLKEVHKGERVGYGKTFVARSDMKIAVMTIGYADGLPRSLSNGVGGVLVGGEYAPVAGDICMDQAMVDVSHIENVQPGDVVTLIGHDGGRSISICEFARQAGTIPNEIVSRFGKRLDRVYIN